jgi:hypothetical protein
VTTLAASSDIGSSLGEFFTQLLSALKPVFGLTVPIPVVAILFLAFCVYRAVK